ncbi:hypothetical protein EG329_008238 [Mollisiaceae sp. DMI_Dod_QoI]|nr:hypothetical protein EG329_008238 [Helotiales sp. DMI_Dod_QoI]
MAADLVSALLSTAQLLRFSGRINAAPHEIHNYMTIIRLTASELESVKSARRSTLCARDRGAELDRKLQNIQVVLMDAENALDWIPRDSNGNLLIGLREALIWIMSYKDVANGYRDVLGLCNDHLTGIKADLDRASRNLSPEAIFFENLQFSTRKMLSEKAAKNAKLYTGPGEQLSRSLAVAVVRSGFLPLATMNLLVDQRRTCTLTFCDTCS